ncbi:PulJ/GspJ family protein [Sutcliffiella deserti]|uniref:PulJ/GspJ family protein n=1 Tax=Sutcliffiella deserti TaxID=2875501 RepID=UPI001CBEAF47|nr:prepilin-type N-terminal cleavage/methylation domain-containing protein [Sutcliffiella deserti]
MIRHINNQRGFTLLELLATIVIGSIVLGVISTVMITTFKQSDHVQNHTALTQEANIIITKMRQIHQENSYTLCYGEDKKLHLDSSESASIAQSSYIFEDVIIDNLDGRKINSIGQCIDKVDPYSPLLIQFNLIDGKENNLNMNTVIQRLKPLSQLTPPPVEEPSEDDFEDIIDDDPSKYEDLTDGCIFQGNKKARNHTTFAPTWGTNCPETIIQNGSLLLMNGAGIFSDVHVDYNLYNKGMTTLLNNGTLTVLENTRFDKDVTLQSSTSFSTGNILYSLGNFTMQTSSQADIGGSAKFDKALALQSNANLSVDRNLFVLGPFRMDSLSDGAVEGNTTISGLEMFSQSNFDIKGDLISDKAVTLENNTTLHIGKVANITGDLHLKGNSEMLVGGDFILNGPLYIQQGTILNIKGNAKFTSSIKFDGNNKGKICVEGSVTFDIPLESGKLVTDISSCERQPEGTIYVLNKN